MPFEDLKNHIVSLSRSSDFEQARTEWDLVSIEISEETDNCPCGQDIREHCYISNRRTGSETYVGNVCINRFLGIKATTLFDGLKRISQNPQAAPNLALIEHAHERGYLFAKERGFLSDTARKRKLSGKQMAWREKINRRILAKTIVARRGELRTSAQKME